MRIAFTSEIWRWDARREDWFFATVPAELSADIGELPREPRGFGAVKVRVRIGGSEWLTSIFPGGDGTYALPLKKAVRDAEGLEFPGTCAVELEVV
jgi:hypothetical protein